MFGIGWDIQPDLVLLDERIQIRADFKSIPFDPSQISATEVSVNDDWFCHQFLAINEDGLSSFKLKRFMNVFSIIPYVLGYPLSFPAIN